MQTALRMEGLMQIKRIQLITRIWHRWPLREPEFGPNQPRSLQGKRELP